MLITDLYWAWRKSAKRVDELGRPIVVYELRCRLASGSWRLLPIDMRCDLDAKTRAAVIRGVELYLVDWLTKDGYALEACALAIGMGFDVRASARTEAA